MPDEAQPAAAQPDQQAEKAAADPVTPGTKPAENPKPAGLVRGVTGSAAAFSAC
ncbi:hypothetical protein HRW22_25155 [Streptomyces lunaelactis]|nr:hypothetical protein [Streptomyces lunaelactis]